MKLITDVEGFVDDGDGGSFVSTPAEVIAAKPDGQTL